MHIRNRIRGMLTLPHERIEPNPNNWRTHPVEQRDALRGLLAEVGVVGAVLVRVIDEAARKALLALPDGDAMAFASWAAAYTGNSMLVDGHLRVEELGPHQLIIVLVLDLDRAEAAEVLATFDPIGGMAGIDKLAFDANLADFDTSNEALRAMCEGLAGVDNTMRDAMANEDGGGVDPTAGRPTQDELEKEFGTTPDESLFWPEFRVKLPKDLLQRMEALVAKEQGKPHERMEQIIERLEG